MFSEYQIMFPIIFYMSKYLQSCVVHYTSIVPAIIPKNLSLPSSLVLVQLLQPWGYRVETTPVQPGENRSESTTGTARRIEIRCYKWYNPEDTE